MGNTNNFEVGYSGESANALIGQINTALDSATKAYDSAVTNLGIVKSKLSGSADFKSYFDRIELAESEEVKKIATSLSNMVAGIQNIGVSWQGVSAEITDVLNKYTSSQNNNNQKS
ncbi:MAG: hypothetical protein IKQ29_00785 [Bacilli bacterium]|nr:hypothetical protein [Bacilli bacterium]